MISAKCLYWHYFGQLCSHQQSVHHFICYCIILRWPREMSCDRKITSKFRKHLHEFHTRAANTHRRTWSGCEIKRTHLRSGLQTSVMSQTCLFALTSVLAVFLWWFHTDDGSVLSSLSHRMMYSCKPIRRLDILLLLLGIRKCLWSRLGMKLLNSVFLN